MDYFQYAKTLTDKYNVSMKTGLSILNLVMWDLKGGNPGVIDDGDLEEIDQRFLQKLGGFSIDTAAIRIAQLPCPGDAFRQGKVIRAIKKIIAQIQ